MLEEEKEPDRRTWRIRFDVDRLAGRVEQMVRVPSGFVRQYC